jgi:hypothetical protein
MLSEGAPFTWGDTELTLVTAERVYDHAYECFEVLMCDNTEDTPDEDEVNDFLGELKALGRTYIDLEN